MLVPGLKSKQQKRVDEAVSAMRAESQVDRNKLRQYSNDFLMYGKYNVDTLQNVIDTVNAMHRQQTELERQASGRAFEDTGRLVESMKFGFDLQFYMKVSDDEHVKQLQVLECTSKEVIRGITVLSQGRLPQEFFLDSRLKEILNEVANDGEEGSPKLCSSCRAHIPLQRHETGNFCCGSTNPFLDSNFPGIYPRLQKTTIISV